jgi:hypothetical protein
MNGFDQFASSEAGASGAERLEPSLPDDFTQDEALFAGELRDAYDIEREDLPSGYVPAVLGYERHKPATPSFERRLTYRVFRALSLPQSPLFERNLMRQFGAALAEPAERLRHAGRATVGVLASALLVMVMSMVFATPSFADGLQILLGHTGVQQVAAYPRNIQQSGPQQVAQLDREEIQIPLYWMGSTVGDYSYLGMRKLPTEVWSKGPVVDIQYVLSHTSKGSGVLDIRTFQVSDRYAAVLKVVQTGSAHETKVGANHAIFVDGAWQTVGGRQVWRNGLRSEVILEKNGVIFWFVGDPRDGLTEDQMLAMANQLVPATRHDLLSAQLTVGSVGHELRSLMVTPAGQDVYALLSRAAKSTTTNNLVTFQSSFSPHQMDMN